MEKDGLARRALHVRRHKVAALSAGQDRDGLPVVFLHGILASPDVWLPTLPQAVREGRRWHSLSLPGHFPGRLPENWRSEEIAGEIFAEVLAEAVRQLSPNQPVVLVGWSTGGFAALNLAARFPELVGGVVSISGFCQGRWHGLLGSLQKLVRRGPMKRWLVERILRSLGSSTLLCGAAVRLQMGQQRWRRHEPWTRQTVALLRRALSGHDAGVMAELFQCIASFDITDQMQRIQAPTLIVGGERDPIIRAAHTRQLAALIPGAQLELEPGVGHFLFAERPQRYHRLLRDWLAHCDASTRDPVPTGLEATVVSC